MEFAFHSVYHNGHHSKYYNIYRIDNDHYRAECHHFNRSRECENDFELIREGDHWKPSDAHFTQEAEHIGEEINRATAR